MERLTYVTEDGEVLFCPEDLPEDEGMTIIQLAKDGRYKELVEIAERLANREQAEEQGRLLRLPCRPNDIVYRINKEVREPIIRMSVERIVLFDNSYALEVTDKYGKHLLFMADDIGKTLYITYEEAQAKLAEMEESYD